MTGDVSSRGAVAAVAGLLFVPVTFLPNAPGDVTLILPWALVNTNPVAVFTVVEYFADPRVSFGSTPRSLQAWPLGFGFLATALASGLAGRLRGREDRRVTGGLLVLAALAALWVTAGLARRGSLGSYPVGAVAIAAVAWWHYRDALSRTVTPG